MKLQLRLLLETAFLTVLIWTYADQASYDSCSAVLAVRVDTPSPDVVARIEEGKGTWVDTVYIPIKLRGPKAAVRKLEMERGNGASVFNLTIPVSDMADAKGTGTRDIRDDAARLRTIRDRGLQVEELSRQVITFKLDRYVATKITVDTDAGKFSEAIEGKPVIEPNTVTVKVLGSDLEKRGTPPDQRMVVSIEEQLRTRAEEGTASFMVPLGSKWEGMDAKFEPAQVRVTVRLAKSYQTVELSLIPLRVLMPPGVVSGDYEIEWQAPADLLQNITVRMPVGKPRTLDSTDVLAFIQIEKSDLPGEPSPTATSLPAGTGGWSQREVRFVFPPGFGDVQVDQPHQVKFRIKKKTTAESLTPLGG